VRSWEFAIPRLILAQRQDAASQALSGYDEDVTSLHDAGEKVRMVLLTCKSTYSFEANKIFDLISFVSTFISERSVATDNYPYCLCK
jgi:hypothetical protein